MNDRPLTPEEFVERRIELPDGGRWTQLVEGEILSLQPPDIQHGNAVLHLSKAIAEAIDPTDPAAHQYACFELGLCVERTPPTVLFPAISIFDDENRFAHLDETVTDSAPRLVVELASTNDRRRRLPDWIDAYFEWGVELVWVVDPFEELVHTIFANGYRESLGGDQHLTGGSILQNFDTAVGPLFAEPEWWTNDRKRD